MKIIGGISSGETWSTKDSGLKRKPDNEIREADSLDKIERVGYCNNRRDDKQFLKEVESYIQKHRKCVATYDVSTVQENGFRAYSYAEACKAVRVKTMNPLTNHELLMDSLENGADLDDKEIEINLGDKYTSIDHEFDEEIETLAIIPGNNLKDHVMFDYIDRLVFVDNKKICIKPHPISSPNYVRALEEKYGLESVLPVGNSLDKYFQKAKNFLIVASSEYSVYSLLKTDNVELITKPSKLWVSTYCDLYWFLKNIPLEKRFLSFKKAILQKDSGFVFKHQDDIEERIKNYFERSWEFNQRYISPLNWSKDI